MENIKEISLENYAFTMNLIQPCGTMRAVDPSAHLHKMSVFPELGQVTLIITNILLSPLTPS